MCASFTGTFEENLYLETKLFFETHAKDIFKVSTFMLSQTVDDYNCTKDFSGSIFTSIE